MTWLVWRQHRAELLALLAAVAVTAVTVLAHGIPMRRAYDRNGIAGCFLAPDASCSGTVDRFLSTYSALPEAAASWLPLSPVFAGILIGAPFLAREFEQGTWQLAWTQAVPRTRWFLTKLAAVVVAVIASTAAVAAMLSWWLTPLSPHRFTPEQFNHAPLVFPGYALLALALGVCAGAALRRSILAAGVALVCWLAVRLPLEFVLRPRYRSPLVSHDAREAAAGWVVSGGRSGPAGLELPSAPMAQPLQYHPVDRFWQFQAIEAGICVVLAVLLLAATYLLVTRPRD